MPFGIDFALIPLASDVLVAKVPEPTTVLLHAQIKILCSIPSGSLVIQGLVCVPNPEGDGDHACLQCYPDVTQDLCRRHKDRLERRLCRYFFHYLLALFDSKKSRRYYRFKK